MALEGSIGAFAQQRTHENWTAALVKYHGSFIGTTQVTRVDLIEADAVSVQIYEHRFQLLPAQVAHLDVLLALNYSSSIFGRLAVLG